MIEGSRTLRQAAAELLRELGPTHYRELTEEILKRGLASSSSKTPAASLNAMMAVDIQHKGEESEFVRLRPGVFGLRALHAPAKVEGDESDAELPEGSEDVEALATDEAVRRVRTPYFPTYCEMRHILKVWPGRPRKQITGLQATLRELRGTPQKTVDWTDPDEWIPERLAGDDRELASRTRAHPAQVRLPARQAGAGDPHRARAGGGAVGGVGGVSPSWP
jgi:restriction system protein